MLWIQFPNDPAPESYSYQESRNLLGFHYLPRLKFKKSSFRKICQSQYPQEMLEGSFFQKACWQAALYKKFLDTGRVTPCSIKWINQQLGFGLFLKKSLQKGAYVGEYAGLVTARHRIIPNTNAYCIYYPTGVWHWRVFMIDARNSGNETRFINHSDRPNIEPFYIYDEENVFRLIFLAKQELAKGEQLTFDYGEDYWRKRQKISIQ